MNDLLTQINDVLWTYVIMVVLVCCGLWFTWRMRFVQFRMLGEMVRLLTDASVSSIPGCSDEDYIYLVMPVQLRG